jgi:hypothetical protein
MKPAVEPGPRREATGGVANGASFRVSVGQGGAGVKSGDNEKVRSIDAEPVSSDFTSKLDTAVLFKHVQMPFDPKAVETKNIAQDNNAGLPEWTPERQLAMETASAAAVTTQSDTKLLAPQALPDDLYSSKVDVQARSWLRELCNQDARVTPVSPND